MTANGNLPYDSGNLNWGSITTERGENGEGGGKDIQVEGDMGKPMADSG